jgi:hypothetical protein
MKEAKAAGKMLFPLVLCLCLSACSPGASSPAGTVSSTKSTTSAATVTSVAATSKTTAPATITTTPASTAKTTAPPAGASKLTMKESFALLCQKTGKNDLKIYSYQAYSIDSQGKSGDWQIVGYSPSENKNYVLRTSSATTKTMDINNPDQKNVTYYPLDRFKDSPEMVAEAMVKTGGKWDDAKCMISFNAAKTTAEVGALNTLIGMYDIPFIKS